MDSLFHSKQSKRFGGAGAAHQNGIAERTIKTICDSARVLMIHVAIHSEEGEISEELWPIAKDHAAWLFEKFPKWNHLQSSRII
eukprot:5237110-Ditylum_brightwellii.AAC.1